MTMGIPWWAQLVAALSLVGGAVAGMLRTIYLWDTRSHPSHCRCNACTEKRARRERIAQIQRRDRERRQERQLHSIGEPNPDDLDDRFLSTAQLESGMLVEYRSTTYLVKDVKTHAGGYYIELENVATNTAFIVMVAFKMADARMWKPKDRMNPGAVLHTGPLVGWDPRVAPPAKEQQDDDEIVVYPYGYDHTRCYMPWCDLGAGHPGRHKPRLPCTKTPGCVMHGGHEGPCHLRHRNTGHSAP